MRRFALSLAVLVGLAVPCAAVPSLTGRVYTQGKVEKVVARLWALGEPVVADPTRAGRPLAETAVAPGQSFAFDLENVALPVRIEFAAAPKRCDDRVLSR